MHLTENCSSLILSLLPPKLKDPGSLLIPCSIQNLKFDNALCDLGARVRILPYKIYEKLSLGDLTPTPMSLQLADRSVMFPLGRVDDVSPCDWEATCGIQPPTTNANNFEIRPVLITLVQSHPFCGKSSESPHEHLKQFEDYCYTIKHNRVASEYVRLKLFWFSLLGRASDWLDKEVKQNSLRTWNEVASAFLSKFYSHGNTAKYRLKIQSFEQKRDESLFEAWDRFKEYQRECPHHVIPKWLLLQTFYLGLSPTSKTSLDAGAGCPIMNNIEDQIEEIIEDVMQNYQAWHVGTRNYDSKGKYEDGKGSAFAIKQANIIEKLSSRLEKLESAPSQPPSPSTIPPPSATLPKGKGKVSSYNTMPLDTSFCDICGEHGHFPSMCHLLHNVSYVEHGSLYEQEFDVEHANAMNERGASSGGYPSNPGGQYGGSQFPPPGFNGPRTYGNNFPQNPIGYGNAPPTLPPLKSNLEALMESFVGAQAKKNVEFEDRLKQSNTYLKMIETQLTQLSSTIKEHQVHTSLPPQGQPPKKMYAVRTRSGKILDDGAKLVDAPCSRGEEFKGIESTNYDVVEEESHVDDVSDGVKPTEATLLPLPYPQKFVGKKLDDQFSMFLDTISKLYVSLSFTEELKKMPHYSRFMRDILCGKRTCGPKETVHLTENCSALILSPLPPKLKDPGSFSTPCSIQNLKFDNALCDLGASVSIFPYKIYEKLSLGDLTPTPMSLQLADRSVMFPLGRPFLATTGALIDVQGGLITLKEEDAKASFKLPSDDGCCSKMKSCMKLDTIACIEHEYSNF
ncbi:uncharacterized protein [Spinacia oleracea]|uniref:Retrotransposon gag domain-containing protein n=1 Tax=Spinacia oleracea TaxID=3562 RepID=A0A9R0K3D2_SPIOL|nr:uncharacterized protein LOC110796247 [Spinacia oleracea]